MIWVDFAWPVAFGVAAAVCFSPTIGILFGLWCMGRIAAKRAPTALPRVAAAKPSQPVQVFDWSDYDLPERIQLEWFNPPPPARRDKSW